MENFDISLTEPRVAGRPAKDPMERIGWPVRALVTQPVIQALFQAMTITGLSGRKSDQVSSDIVRLAIHRMLDDMGIMTDKLREDPSWDTLKESGHV